MYHIAGDVHIRAWMAAQPSREDQDAFLDWLPTLATDPEGVCLIRKKRPGVPAYVAEVPGTEVFVDYTVVEQYKTVAIIFLVDVGLDPDHRF